MPQIFEVGGCVRDEILGIKSNDIDFSFVLDNTRMSVDEGFQSMTNWLLEKGFKVFLSTPECFTIRAKFPKGTLSEGLIADFVMARKELGPIEGTRRANLEIGSLEDDLRRRDFTMNAIAKAKDGSLIDPFGGIKDIEARVIDTPMSPLKGKARKEFYKNSTKDNIIKRAGTANEVAKAIIFAIENEFITGTTIDIDGGWILS